MSIRGRWTRISVDNGRCFVYGPTLGRLYLLNEREATDRVFQRLFGLGSFAFCNELIDPAENVLHHLSNLKETELVPAPAALQWTYRILHRSRHVIPFRLMASSLARIASWRKQNDPLSVSEIGCLLYSIESAVGYGDCYPRALLTSYLCCRNGHGCDLAIGALAPTRKMHAWCSTSGQLPYEPSPEHYMYQPLIILTFPA